MIKFFVIAWITMSAPNQTPVTDWVVNTTLSFDSQQDCEVYTGLEAMPLTSGIEKYIKGRWPLVTIEVNEIACVSQDKLKAMGKIRNN